MTDETPRELVVDAIMIGMAIAMIGSHVDKTLSEADQTKALEKDLTRFAESIVKGIERVGITFVKREDIPAAFGEA